MRSAIPIILFIATLMFFAFVFAYLSRAAEVTLAWDYPADQSTDGFKIYLKGPGKEYDYAKPTTTTGPDARSVKVAVADVAGSITKYSFVARAFRAGRDSENSNQCDYTLDLAPIVPPNGLKCFIEGAAK